MADEARRRPENVAGPWFVDDTCIDCGTCMWMAPQVFEGREGQAAVHRQPKGPAEDEAAMALLSCPTGSIGGPARLAEAAARFPRPVASDVWHCGFHDRATFGAAAYLVRTKKGNVLVDVPRFAGPLVKTLEAMGGIDWIVMTHRDDVGHHAKWAQHFGAKRAMHRDDGDIGAEKRLKGSSGTVGGLQWIHVPGHTEGHVVYRHGDVLLTGDHLAGRRTGGLTAFRGACWYDWGAQTGSMRSLAGLDITHVLPGHGAPWAGSAEAYRKEMARLVDWMETV